MNNSPGSSPPFDVPVDPSFLALLDQSIDEHFVEFYESDSFLIRSMARFAAAGLNQGEAVLIILTADHLERVEKLLTSQGLNIATLKTQGSYIARDANATLDELNKIEHLSFETITAFFNLCLEQRTNKNQPIRACGEMVSILCEQERFEKALEIEALWDQLQRQHNFPLFCAYRIDAFARTSHTKFLEGVCLAHSKVIPTESYSTLIPENEKLRSIALLQQQALTLSLEVAEHRRTEERLNAVKNELEVQLALSEDLLQREHVARNEAESANRMKDEFLATISHELRTPLNAMIGWSHMLSTGQLDDETSARAIDAIARNAKVQAQLIEDILDVSRAIAGKIRLKLAPADSQTFISAAIDSMQLVADSKNLTIEVNLDSSADPILGDSNRLQQVIWNILSNAIKFTPAGGSISVQSKQLVSGLEIIIRDNGQGIDPQFLPCVFDRFRQADPSSTRRHGGLGLGLSIVRHIIDLHGGSISVESAGIGHGATFKIGLPTFSVPASGESKTVESVCQSGLLAGVRVLAVDHDRASLELLGAIFEQQGACFQLAESAESALSILHRYLPDVLVLDLEMPGEDGYSLLTKIRSLEASTSRSSRAIALTGHVRVEDRARALGAGFDMFVPKPIEADELVQAIASLSLRAK